MRCARSRCSVWNRYASRRRFSAPGCRRRRSDRGFCAKFAAPETRRYGVAQVRQSASRQLLHHRLRQIRPDAGRAADRRPRAGLHRRPRRHARFPAAARACRASAAERRRRTLRRNRHCSRPAGARDDRPWPHCCYVADGGRPALPSESRRRAHQQARLPDASGRQRSVLQQLRMRRRPIRAARLRARQFHRRRGRDDGPRRDDPGAALRQGPRRQDTEG